MQRIGSSLGFPLMSNELTQNTKFKQTKWNARPRKLTILLINPYFQPIIFETLPSRVRAGGLTPSSRSTVGGSFREPPPHSPLSCVANGPRHWASFAAPPAALRGWQKQDWLAPQAKSDLCNVHEHDTNNTTTRNLWAQNTHTSLVFDEDGQKWAYKTEISQ